MPQIIGKLIKSNAHIDYVCQVFQPGEIETPPAPEDFAFGRFVRLPLTPGQWLVGLIYDTILLAPEFGRLGPRLSSPAELAVFAPDYLTEKAVLVGVIAIGTINEAGAVDQRLPTLSARTDTVVERMTDEQVRSFHLPNGELHLTYLPRLLGYSPRLSLDLLRTVLYQLQSLTGDPDHQNLLALLLDNLSWRHQVVPLGEA